MDYSLDDFLNLALTKHGNSSFYAFVVQIVNNYNVPVKSHTFLVESVMDLYG